MPLVRRIRVSLFLKLCNDLCGRERMRSVAPLTSLCPCPRTVLAFLRQAGVAMKKCLGRGVVGMPGVVFQAFTDCDCCPGMPSSDVGTVRTPSRRVLKLPPVAQAKSLAFRAFLLLEAAQELPRGWSCTGDAA